MAFINAIVVVVVSPGYTCFDSHDDGNIGNTKDAVERVCVCVCVCACVSVFVCLCIHT